MSVTARVRCASSTKQQSAFGDYLDDLLHDRGLSVTAFGRLVGLRTTSVSAAKRQTLSLERIPRWANALGLSGEQRELFYELAMLTHCPPPIQRLVQQQQREIEHLREDRRRQA